MSGHLCQSLNLQIIIFCFIYLSQIHEEKKVYLEPREVNISFGHLENIFREVYSELIGISL